MGLIIDTNVFIHAEKRDVAIDFMQWAHLGGAFISAITVSELLFGVHRANTPARRRRRQEFVETIISTIPALDVTTEVARAHAELLARLGPAQSIGAHDAWIGATAIYNGHAVLTDNVRDFSRLKGLTVVPLFPASPTSA